jgi:LacI family transcriptional regulator
LRTRKSHCIGIIVTDIQNPFYSELTVSAEKEFNLFDRVIFLTNTSEDIKKQKRAIISMLEYNVDGLLLCPAIGTSSNDIDNILRSNIPLVLFSRYINGADVDYVGANNTLGAVIAVEHLINLGHKRIAFIGGPDYSSARKDRIQGFFIAHNRNGLNVDESLLISSDVTREGGFNAVLELLKLKNPPTAAICYNDIVAFGVILGLHDANLINKFSVIGFDDIDEAKLWKPALTTVSIKPSIIGRESARLLIKIINDSFDKPKKIILKPKLIIRESCGYFKNNS